MAVTVPETVACSGTEFLPPAFAITWPIFTVSPTETTGTHASPDCILVGISTSGGGGATTEAIAAVFL